jgi:UDP-glucose 4-epimerase
MKKNLRAVVTGGCGFIGSHMVDMLMNKGFEVVVIDNLICGNLDNLNRHKKNPLLKVEELDIRNIDVSGSLFKNTDFVFHFAGIGDIVPSIEKPEEYMSVNVLGTLRVLECSRQSNITKFVYAASSSCYGLANTPTDENHKIQPLYPYAISKFHGAELVRYWNKVYNIPYNTICIFNAYGPRVKTAGAYGAVFGVFLKQKLENKPYTVVGDGTQKRDFIYVTDVVKAFYLAATSKISSEVFNVGSANPQTINKLIELIGDGEKVYLPSRPGEPLTTHADISKIKKMLNWKPSVSFETGVNEMLKNISYWENAPLWNKEKIENATEQWFKYLK